MSTPLRALYMVENIAIEPVVPTKRSLYEIENIAVETVPMPPPRHLYALENINDGTIYPWLEKIKPTEAQPGQQILVYGDGFGATPPAFTGVGNFGSEAMGEAAWGARSPGLWPANAGTPTEPILTIIVPDDATDGGMITVTEDS